MVFKNCAKTEQTQVWLGIIVCGTRHFPISYFNNRVNTSLMTQFVQSFIVGSWTNMSSDTPTFILTTPTQHTCVHFSFDVNNFFCHNSKRSCVSVIIVDSTA